jgi:hypothetical protein
MNWKEISEKYPKAFWEFVQWCYNTHFLFSSVRMHHFTDDGALILKGTGGESPEVRWLYDYFDGLGMKGCVDCFDPDVSNFNTAIYFSESIHAEYSNGGAFGHQGKYPSRTAAESALFTRMFELREADLTKGATDAE